MRFSENIDNLPSSFDHKAVYTAYIYTRVSAVYTQVYLLVSVLF